MKNRVCLTVDSSTVTRLKDWLNPILCKLAKTKIKFAVEILNDFSVIDGKPIIFGANHSSFYDVPVMINAVKRRCCILAGKQRMPLIDRIFFNMNGVIWVDRKDRNEMAESKRVLLEYLSRGQWIIWYPEGTWNLTSNLLMLPMRWGIIEVARQANAQIVPLALDYDFSRRLCRVKFGGPLAGDDLKDNGAGIRILRDTIATLRWEMMADKPVLSRAETDPDKLKSEVESALMEYPALDWEYERSCIYEPPGYISPDKAFEYLRHLVH